MIVSFKKEIPHNTYYALCGISLKSRVILVMNRCHYQIRFTPVFLAASATASATALATRLSKGFGIM